jgi:hypothetical protein
MPALYYTDEEAARALSSVIGNTRWEAVAIASGYLAKLGGSSDEQAANEIFQYRVHTRKRCMEIAGSLKERGFLQLLAPRERVGSAENPVTKLFPAAITERRFLYLVDELHGRRPAVCYSDERDTGHTLTDFRLNEEGLELPINVKNAGTRFERAHELVGLDPADCVPIPAYKAHLAIESVPNLLYVISVDYDLVGKLNNLIPQMLTGQEIVAWDMLNKYTGPRVRNAEDQFVSNMVEKYWEEIEKIAQNTPFHAISARRAVRVLQTKPERTPGIGLRAWGTGASAEVNVHISIKDETTLWEEVSQRIASRGIFDIVQAINRRHLEEVYDPEI